MKPLLLVLLLACMTTAKAQINVSNVTKLTMEDYLALELPALGTLLENAKQNPTVEFYDTKTEEEKSVLKSERRSWLTYIKLNATYQYGHMNDNSVLYDANIPVYNQFRGKEQSWYNVGASLSLPLSEIFDRRNRIRRQRLKIKETELEVGRWHDDQSLKIIDAYTAAIQNLSMLKARAEAVTLAQAQYKISEADFINGKLDAQTLSRQKNIESQAVADYEQTKSQLNKALLRLEVLSRTKIINQ